MSALETVVLPRNGVHPHHPVRCSPWPTGCSSTDGGPGSGRANLRGPVRTGGPGHPPLVWMLSVTVGFTLIFWGIDAGTLGHSFEVSGSSLFTLGFAEPPGSAPDLADLRRGHDRAGTGGPADQLPAHHLRRPPRPREGHQRPAARSPERPPRPSTCSSPCTGSTRSTTPTCGGRRASWLLELDQTHAAFPALCYFPESDGRPVVGGVGGRPARRRRASAVRQPDRSTASRPWSVRGPMLALAYGVPSLVGIGRAAGLPIEPSGHPARASWPDGSGSRPRPSRSAATEYLAALDRLDSTWPSRCPSRTAKRPGDGSPGSAPATTAALRGLAGLTMAPPAQWTTDRPAMVGRPRLLTNRPIEVDWSPTRRSGPVGRLGQPASRRLRTPTGG